ncbi:hypothetical protein HUU39_28655, partial [candidate division KSB1 bacterium]|nr:hypothetical protein [candidate division KSB1 bacterium]
MCFAKPDWRCIALALLGGLGTSALAQGERDFKNTADSTVYEFEQVTVTALRAPEQAIKVPLAVSVVGLERL